MVERADTFIRSLGVEAYRVGGSVRDEILGRRVKDADYMVRGVDLHDLGVALEKVDRPGRITPLVDRRGQQFGWRHRDIEIALPRREANAGEGRAQTIIADPSLTVAEDATRRDFTFNALYKIVSHPNNLTSRVAGPNGVVYEDILDPLGSGLEDLQRRQIRTTHPDSFRDDPLRTLRALRFVSVLGYDLHVATRVQMAAHADAVTGLSAAGYASGTVLDEMSRILMGREVRRALRIARDTGVLGTLLPELAPMLGYDQGSRYHDLTTDEHTFKALETAAHVDAPLRVRWALLFHDSGKPATAWIGKDGRKHYYGQDGTVAANDAGMTIDHEAAGERIWRKAAERLNVPARLREDVAHLIEHHMVPLSGKFKASKVRQMRVVHGDDMLRDLFLHRACDVSGKEKGSAQAIQRLSAMEFARSAAAEAGVPASPADLAVDGHDMKELGLGGRDIGRVLKAILHEVASQPTEVTRSRDWQISRARALA